MEQTHTETKLKLEADIAELKRQYKYALENLERVKGDTKDILDLKDRATAEIDARNEELTSLLNEISNEKLTWVVEKQSQIDKLEERESAAQNILNRKDELNAQEEEIRQIEARDTEIRNEARRLELKNESTALEFENREKQIKVLKGELEDKKKEFENDKKAFKDQVIKVLNQAETI